MALGWIAVRIISLLDIMTLVMIMSISLIIWKLTEED